MIVKLLLIVSVFFAFLFSQSVVLAHEETVTIFLTDEGFEPRKVTTHQGSLINFINKGTIDRWPASDFHPTHALYPDFDPRKVIPPGEVWGFRAEKVGVWRFHDHLNPHVKGTVIVQGEEQAPKNGWWDNLVNFLFSLWPKPRTEEKAEAGWTELVEKHASESGTSGKIHDLAHAAGGLLFDEKKWEGLAVCTPKFAFGCYHGFFDHAFAESVSGLPLAYQGCLKVGKTGSGPFGSCIHGIGHGVASFYHTSELGEALKECDRLPSGQQFCYDGVFMEFERGAGKSFYREDNLVYPCDSVSEKYVYSCGRNAPNVLMGRFKKSFLEISQVCLETAGPFREGCFDALGYISAGQAIGNPTKAIALCQSIGEEREVNRCLIKAAGEFIFQEIPGWQSSSGAICSALLGEAKEECHNYIQGIAADYGRK